MCTKTLCSLDTGYYADTVEWCPVEGFESYLVCGTYQLLEKNGRGDESAPDVRVGNVQLYCLDEMLGRFEKNAFLFCFFQLIVLFTILQSALSTLTSL